MKYQKVTSATDIVLIQFITKVVSATDTVPIQLRIKFRISVTHVVQILLRTMLTSGTMKYQYSY
jgi:hypothetical protein